MGDWASNGEVLFETACNRSFGYPKPDTLTIYLSRGDASAEKDSRKVLRGFSRVVIEVDGERHEYDADALVALLDELEKKGAE